jgi:hypothetical protein
MHRRKVVRRPAGRQRPGPVVAPYLPVPACPKRSFAEGDAERSDRARTKA